MDEGLEGPGHQGWYTQEVGVPQTLLPEDQVVEVGSSVSKVAGWPFCLMSSQRVGLARWPEVGHGTRWYRGYCIFIEKVSHVLLLSSFLANGVVPRVLSEVARPLTQGAQS